MIRPIGYYAHHQGLGHLRRANTIAAAVRSPCTILSSGPRCDGNFLELPTDQIVPEFNGVDREADRPTAMHYAPVGVSSIRHRMAMIAAWIDVNQPALFIVDVSVEIALFVRLLSVPLVVVRLSGDRRDVPHLEAFRAATWVMCPFPAALEHEATPQWVRAKTIYAGFLASPSVRGATIQIEPGRVAVIVGHGGDCLDIETITAAATANPHLSWHAYGRSPFVGRSRENFYVHGWVSDIASELDRADVVVGTAGDDLIANVAARGKAFICRPEDRPFDEQKSKAKRLSALNALVMLDDWPHPLAWGSLILQAKALRQNWQTLYRSSDISDFACKLDGFVAQPKSDAGLSQLF